MFQKYYNKGNSNELDSERLIFFYDIELWKLLKMGMKSFRKFQKYLNLK